MESSIHISDSTTHAVAEQEDSYSLVFSNKSQNQLAMDDIKAGFSKWHIWLMLAYQDIKLRYRRSILGPFWITLSMAITVYSMGYLYSHLFHVNISTYFPLLVSGMLSWSLISTTTTDLVDTFTTTESMIKQIKLPYSLYINKVASRNLIIFFHNIIVIVPILLIYNETAKINLCTFLLIPSLMLIYINAISYGLILAMIGARYRDVSQIVKSLIQVIFFVTPVMWDASNLPPTKRFIAWLNPFYAYIELIRAPLLGKLPSLMNLLVALAMTIIGVIISFHMFSRYRSRIVYWL